MLHILIFLIFEFVMMACQSCCPNFRVTALGRSCLLIMLGKSQGRGGGSECRGGVRGG